MARFPAAAARRIAEARAAFGSESGGRESGLLTEDGGKIAHVGEAGSFSDGLDRQHPVEQQLRGGLDADAGEGVERRLPAALPEEPRKVPRAQIHLRRDLADREITAQVVPHVAQGLRHASLGGTGGARKRILARQRRAGARSRGIQDQLCRQALQNLRVSRFGAHDLFRQEFQRPLHARHPRADPTL